MVPYVRFVVFVYVFLKNVNFRGLFPLCDGGRDEKIFFSLFKGMGNGSFSNLFARLSVSQCVGCREPREGKSVLCIKCLADSCCKGVTCDRIV